MAVTHQGYISQSLVESGLGHVIVLRKKSPLKVEMGVFLVDSYCMGIRDAYLVEDTEDELQVHLDEHPQTLDPKPAGYLRKLVEEAIDYARKFGFAPHKDYKKAARVFGGVKADPQIDDFTFGLDGKPFYVQSTFHSDQDAERIVAKLTRICGEDGFESDLDADDDDPLFDGEFEERIVLTEGYFDGGTTSPELDYSGSSEAAQKAFLKFQNSEQFVGDPLFDRPVWVYPDGETTFDAMLEVTDVIMEASPEDSSDPGMRFVFFSFLNLLMNLHCEDEETAETHLYKLKKEGSMPAEAVAFLRELRKSEEMQELLDRLVYPEPGITVRPMGVELIDEKNGHCLFVCLELCEPE